MTVSKTKDILEYQIVRHEKCDNKSKNHTQFASVYLETSPESKLFQIVKWERLEVEGIQIGRLIQNMQGGYFIKRKTTIYKQKRKIKELSTLFRGDDYCVLMLMNGV